MQLPFRWTVLPIASFLISIFLGANFAVSQTFSGTGSMALQLLNHTATPLQNGDVLIAGGDNAAGITSTAEIYNPSNGTFVPTGSMSVKRNNATATLLNDGTVLIAGGSDDKSAEIYNPSTGAFSLTSGSMTAARYNATATLLKNGTVLIAGGDIGDYAGLTSAEVYNPATGTFAATTGSMSKRRTYHTATLLPDGTVLIAGGEGNYSGEAAWNTAEVYDPSTQQFTPVGNMTTTRVKHTATLLTDGTVLITGGENTTGVILSSAEIYTPSTSSFAATTGSMNSSHIYHTATPLEDGTVLIAGGFDNPNSTNAVSSAEIYSPSQGTFTPTGSMTVARAFQTATLLANGDVLIAGGEESSSSILSSAELYSYQFTQNVIYPAYQVVSILYASPGNQSQASYTDTITGGTTTSIGSNFTSGNTIGFTEGFGKGGSGGSATESFGTSVSSSQNTAFTESFSLATQVANKSLSSNPDAVNHNNDQFLIWLDPQVVVNGAQTTPAFYSVGVQPTSTAATPLPDILQVPAYEMEADSAGVTTVDAPKLNQQNTASGIQPGLASICKNLIQSEYNAGTCTKADQCGCTPADFLAILETDPLLFYNGPTNPVSPYPGTANPLEANTSSGAFSDANCGTLPTPNLTGSSCRFVPVPAALNAPYNSNQENPPLNGGGESPDAFSLGENQQESQTLGVQTTETVKFSDKAVLGPIFSIMDEDSWSWTNSQSIGTANGTGYVQQISLNSSTVGCEEYIPIFEDTVYHTFVFQELPDSGSTCTQNSPSFSISATPNNPSQTALSLGHSMSYTVAVSAWFGFNGTVALSASGLPVGVMASFSPNSVTTSGTGSATLTLTAAYSTSTYIGNSNITITGTSNGVTQSAIIPLTTRPLQYAGYCGVQ